jgi:hypothetical protein
VQVNSGNFRAKIDKACYEVVVKKPENDSLTYEKELPWDLISYQIRNDKYFPLGYTQNNFFRSKQGYLDLNN